MLCAVVCISNCKPSTNQLIGYLENYRLPTDLPSSSSTVEQAITIRFLCLCEKYIIAYSDFEINISHRNRLQLTNIYHNFELNIDKLIGKISKLNKMFGDPMINHVSRRASSALEQQMSVNLTSQHSNTRDLVANTPAIDENVETDGDITINAVIAYDNKPELKIDVNAVIDEDTSINTTPSMQNINSESCDINHTTKMESNPSLQTILDKAVDISDINGDESLEVDSNLIQFHAKEKENDVNVKQNSSEHDRSHSQMHIKSTNNKYATHKISSSVCIVNDMRGKSFESDIASVVGEHRQSRNISQQLKNSTKSLLIRPSKHAQAQISRTNLHSCIEDYQLIPDKNTIQEIYDALCYVLGDVYSNLNDSCLRFMDTEVIYCYICVFVCIRVVFVFCRCIFDGFNRNMHLMRIWKMWTMKVKK